jgi:hypothetical protein
MSAKLSFKLIVKKEDGTEYGSYVFPGCSESLKQFVTACENAAASDSGFSPDQVFLEEGGADLR